MPASPDIINNIKQGLYTVESKGQGGYNALGVIIPSGAYKGDRAYGKYQIMGNNIPSWTKEATGTSYSKEDFLKNPDLQEKVTSYKVGKLYDQYQNPSDVASAWFTGGPAKTAGNKKDANGTTTPNYIKGVLKGMNPQGGGNTNDGGNDPSSSFLGSLTGAKTAYASTGNSQNDQSTQLQEGARSKLDGIVQQMIANNESDSNINMVVADFKQKYGNQSQSSNASQSSGVQPQNQTSTIQQTQPPQQDQSTGLAQNTGFLGTNPTDSLYGKLLDNSITRGIRGVGNALTFGGTEQLGQATGKDLYAATTGDLSDVADPMETLKGGGKTLAGVGLLAAGGLLRGAKTAGALGSSIVTDILGPEAATFTAAEKATILGNELKNATLGAKPVIEQVIKELTPQILKEAGAAPGLITKVVTLLKSHPIATILGMQKIEPAVMHIIKGIYDKYIGNQVSSPNPNNTITVNPAP